MKIRVNHFCASILWLLITLIEYEILTSMAYSSDNLRIVTYLAIGNLFLQLVTIAILHNIVISFFVGFLVFLYLFHFGQVITACYFPDAEYDIVNYLLYYMSDSNYAWKTLILSLISINMYFSGGILINQEYGFTGSFNKAENIEAFSDVNLCALMGRLLFTVSIPFKLYYDIRQFSAALSGGYAAARSIESFSGVFGAIASFWYVSIPLIYLTINDKRNKKLFLTVVLTYIVLSMLTGNRGHQVVNIISILIIVYYLNNKKINSVKIIQWGALGFLGLVFINLIFNIRRFGISYFFDNYYLLITKAFEENVIIDTLHNFGATIYTPYLVICGYGTDYTPFFGETYIKSFVSVIPDVFHMFSNWNNEAIYSRVLNTRHAIGGSFIGELYYNFGTVYWLFAFIFGQLYADISKKLYYAVTTHNYKFICMYYPFASYSLWWVRDTVGGVTRSVVWLLLLYLILSRSKMVNQKIRKISKT